MNKTMQKIADAVASAQRGQLNRNGRNMSHYSVGFDHAGRTTVVYRGTCVATINDNEITLYDGGWQTVTTKNVMNAAIAGMSPCSYANVYQKNWEWRVNGPDDDVAFYNGMTLVLPA